MPIFIKPREQVCRERAASDAVFYYDQFAQILVDDNNEEKNLQFLIDSQNEIFFNSVEPNTEQKYIILNYPRVQQDGLKRQNNVLASPTITINHIGTKKFKGNFANFIKKLGYA